MPAIFSRCQTFHFRDVKGWEHGCRVKWKQAPFKQKNIYFTFLLGLVFGPAFTVNLMLSKAEIIIV